MNKTTQPAFMNWYKTVFIMAALAGFADVMGFIGMDRLFTAHITGNIVIAIVEIMHHEKGVACKIDALIVFCIFSIILSWFIETLAQSLRLLAFLLVLETFLLFGFMIAGIEITPYWPVNSWQYISAAMLGICAMAIHNVLLKTYFAHFPPCTVMTGNLSRMIVDTVAHFLQITRKSSLEKRKKSLQGLKQFGNVLAGFFIGGACAAFGYNWIGFWATTLEVIVCGIFAIQVCLIVKKESA